MINLSNMNRQHNTITTEISFIENEINKNKEDINTTEIALHINKLAGQLKIHLLEEDKFLYPNLLKCEDKEVQMLAKQYIKEMGDLSDAFIQYKNAYNVSSKINEDIEKFIIATKNSIDALKLRITKEDNDLYRIIKERNI